jgi:glucose-6-phosphate isomerase, archaeal
MFSWVGPLPEPQVRTVEDLKGVLANERCDKEGPVYYMYRNLAKSGTDREWWAGQQLRYDVTVIPPAAICGEYVKTKGHYHPVNPNGTGYPEIYEVLEGSAAYLLQESGLRDAVMVQAGKGERVLIPPGYGHVTINTDNETLVMANIVSTAFESLYGEYESHHGAVYYCMADGTYKVNPHYAAVPYLRHLKMCNFRNFSFLEGASFYELMGNDEALRFLNAPEKFDFRLVLL